MYFFHISLLFFFLVCARSPTRFDHCATLLLLGRSFLLSGKRKAEKE